MQSNAALKAQDTIPRIKRDTIELAQLRYRCGALANGLWFVERFAGGEWLVVDVVESSAKAQGLVVSDAVVEANGLENAIATVDWVTPPEHTVRAIATYGNVEGSNA